MSGHFWEMSDQNLLCVSDTVFFRDLAPYEASCANVRASSPP